jgi:hypothetical protein
MVDRQLLVNPSGFGVPRALRRSTVSQSSFGDVFRRGGILIRGSGEWLNR